MAEQAVNTPHKAFRGSLEGQVVTIPSIYKLIPGWQPNLHEGYKRARGDELDPWIRRYSPLTS
jgi:hypothetical protein